MRLRVSARGSVIRVLLGLGERESETKRSESVKERERDKATARVGERARERCWGISGLGRGYSSRLRKRISDLTPILGQTGNSSTRLG